MNNMEQKIFQNTSLQIECKDLKQQMENKQRENAYLKSEVEKYKVKIKNINTCQNTTDYKNEYKILKEQLDNAKKIIKYLSNLI